MFYFPKDPLLVSPPELITLPRDPLLDPLAFTLNLLDSKLSAFPGPLFIMLVGRSSLNISITKLRRRNQEILMFVLDIYAKTRHSCFRRLIKPSKLNYFPQLITFESAYLPKLCTIISEKSVFLT